MDLREINTMLSYQVPGKIESGQLKKLLVPLVQANDDESKGKLIFYYNDLKVKIESKDEKTWTKIKTGVINFAANDLILSSNNPTKTGIMKTGTIYAPRIKELGFPNYFWRCAFSGLKSTVGFNSKDQKSIIKKEKVEIVVQFN